MIVLASGIKNYGFFLTMYSFMMNEYTNSMSQTVPCKDHMVCTLMNQESEFSHKVLPPISKHPNKWPYKSLP